MLPDNDPTVVPFAAKPTVTAMPVTPATARHWLESNTNNRSVRDIQVRKFASDMDAGRWRLTAEPIKFSVTGRLLDGQHRLHAVIESGQTVTLFVARGLPEDSQAFMDTGTKRTVADQLNLTGYSNVHVLASGAKLALAWTTDRLDAPTSMISDPEVREFISAYPSLQEAAAFTSTMRSKGLEIAPSVICAAYWSFVSVMRHDETLVAEFFRSMAELRMDGPGDPRHALMQRVATARRQRERIPVEEMLSMVVRTFNAHYHGKSLRRMPSQRSGDSVRLPRIVTPKPAS